MFHPDPVLTRALLRWQRAAGPYWPYVCAAPFLSSVAPAVRAPRRTSAARTLVRVIRGLPANQRHAVFVDLAPTWTLSASPMLNELDFTVVPVIQRWVAKPSVLPCERLLGQLVAYGSQVRQPPDARGVVFLLDGERAGPTSRLSSKETAPRVFDNRYAYKNDRFPSASFLLQDGIRRAIVLGLRQAIAPDLQTYTWQLAKAGIRVEAHSLVRPDGDSLTSPRAGAVEAVPRQ